MLSQLNLQSTQQSDKIQTHTKKRHVDFSALLYLKYFLNILKQTSNASDIYLKLKNIDPRRCKEKIVSVMVKYSSQSFTTEHSTAEKKITSPIIEKKDLIYAR